MAEFYEIFFARPERGVKTYCSATGTRSGGTQDSLAQPAGAEAGLQDRRAWSAVAQWQ